MEISTDISMDISVDISMDIMDISVESVAILAQAILAQEIYFLLRGLLEVEGKRFYFLCCTSSWSGLPFCYALPHPGRSVFPTAPGGSKLRPSCASVSCRTSLLSVVQHRLLHHASLSLFHCEEVAHGARCLVGLCGRLFY